MASSTTGFENFDQIQVNGKPVTKLKVDELKAELVARGLEKKGVKKELLERLCAALEKEHSTDKTKEKSAVNDVETSVPDVSSTTETRQAGDDQEVTKERKDFVESEKTQDKHKSSEADPAEVTIQDEEKRSKENGGKDKEIVKKVGKERKNGEMEDGEIQEDEKKEVKKPAPEKRRKISLTRQLSDNPPTPGTRKRKWGSSQPKTSVVISTDSLKGLIPGVQLASTPALEAVMTLDDDKEDEEMGGEAQDEEKQKGENEKKSLGKNLNDKQEENVPHKKRIVQVADSKMIKLGAQDNDSDKNDIAEPAPVNQDSLAGSHDDNQSSEPPPTSEPSTPVKREVSPACNPPSCAVHVANLVRPFTQKQLMQYLSLFGAVTDDGFWMNKIKSHCYAIYSTVEEATNARQSMHGQRWPATSPKALIVDFAENEKMLTDTDGVLGKKVEVEERHEETAEEGKETRKEELVGKQKEKKEEEKKDEPSAANLLDKLFRKTTATPCIYWLPLTNEQIVERAKEREERKRKRELALEEEQKLGELKDARNAQQVKKPQGTGKEREMPRDEERRPLRDNRASSPPPRQRRANSPSPRQRRANSPSPRQRRANSPSPRQRRANSPSPRQRRHKSPSPRRRASSPPLRQRPERRLSPVKRRSPVGQTTNRRR